MKYIDFVLATFAGLALAAPQDAVGRPTAEEYSGKKPMTLQRVLEINEGVPIHCNQYEPHKLSCSSPWMRKEADKDPNAINELSPLCEKKGVCTTCSYDTAQDREAGEVTFTCEYVPTKECLIQMSDMLHACTRGGSPFEVCREKADKFGDNGCQCEQ